MPVQPGRTARVSLTVGDSDTAIAMGSGSVPALATPRVLALMESAAVAAIAGALDPGQTTVGVSAELTHSAATPIGGHVDAEAEVTAVDGRQLDFAITVVDQATGSKVAEGRHRRIVVDYERFVQRLAAVPPDRT